MKHTSKIIIFFLGSIFILLFITGCISKHVHVYNNKIPNDQYLASEATCTEKAKYYYSCECGDLGTNTFEYGDKLGHSFEHHEGKSATCTESGYEPYDICGRCGYSTYEEIKPLGHKYESVITNPTCTSEGYETFICQRCGEQYITNYVPAKGHTEGLIVKEDMVLASFDSCGYHYDVIYCAECGECLKRTYVYDSDPLTGDSDPDDIFNSIYFNSLNIKNCKSHYLIDIKYAKSGLFDRNVTFKIEGNGEKIGSYYNGSADFYINNNAKTDDHFSADVIYPYYSGNTIKTLYQTADGNKLFFSFNPIIIGKGIFIDLNSDLKESLIYDGDSTLSVSLNDKEFKDQYNVIISYFSGYINSLNEKTDISETSFSSVSILYKFANGVIKSCAVTASGSVSKNETVDLTLFIEYSEVE